jgi:hypothetical protein
VKYNILLLWLFSAAIGFSQYPYRNTIGTNAIETNPALTGFLGKGELNFNRKRTWHQFLDWYNINYHSHLKQLNSGIGMSYTNQTYGETKLYITTVSYAYQTNLGKKMVLSAGISGTIQDFRNLFFFDGFQQKQTDTVKYFTINTGVVLSHHKFFLSLGLNSILIRHKRAPIFRAIFGYRFKLGAEKNVALIPNLTYLREGFDAKMGIRMQTNYKKLKTLVGYSSQQIAEVGIGFEFKRFILRYQLNYDFYGYYQSFKPNAFTYLFNLQLKLPKQIDRSSNAFGFSLF